MTRAKKDQGPRIIDLTIGQAIRIERAQADYREALARHAQPLGELRDAEEQIQTALNEILHASSSEPSPRGWRFVVDGDSAQLIEGEADEG